LAGVSSIWTRFLSNLAMEKAARPFLKWSGGKTQLLPELLKRVPADYRRYHELFLGGGALFFALRPKVAYLNDLNEELINAYRVIRDSVEALVDELDSGRYRNDAATFYQIRSERPTGEVYRAARTVYLNKTCFNGLFRVNKNGGFNAPFGKYKNPTICDQENLRAVSAALQGVHLWSQDFENASVGMNVVEGDFVYIDPPYVPLSATSNFTAYTASGFGFEQQVFLRDLALHLKNRGVHVLLSNSGSPLVEELYGKNFTLEPVAARRSINSAGEKRGPVKEYLIS
jgi:DNA adenine methylase